MIYMIKKKRTETGSHDLHDRKQTRKNRRADRIT